MRHQNRKHGLSIPAIPILIVLIGLVLVITLKNSRRNSREPSPQPADYKNLILEEIFKADPTNWVFGYKARPTGQKPIFILTFSRAESTSFVLLQILNRIRLETGGRIDTLAIELPKKHEQQTPSKSNALTLEEQGWSSISPILEDTNFKIWKSLGSQPWPSGFLIDPNNGSVLQHWSPNEFLSNNLDKLIHEITKHLESEPKGPMTSLNIRHTLDGNAHYWADVTEGLGNFVIADSAANQIYLFHKATKRFTEIGSGAPGFSDGSFGNAQFRYPTRIACDKENNRFYVLEMGNQKIRSIDLDSLLVSSIDSEQERLPIDIVAGSGQLYSLNAVAGFTQFEIRNENHGTPNTNLDLMSSLGSFNLQFHSDDRSLSTFSDSNPMVLNVYNLGRESWLNKALPGLQHSPWSTRRAVVDIQSQTIWHAQENRGTVVKSINLTRPNETFEQDLGEFHSRISGLNLANNHLITWDALALTVCEHMIPAPLPQSQSNYESGHTELPPGQCINISSDSFKPTSDEVYFGGRNLIIKAGVESEIDLQFKASDDYALSTRDLHKLQLPGNELIAIDQSHSRTFHWKAPSETGASRIEFFPIVCQIAEPGRCKRIKIFWPVEIRESTGYSQISLHSNLSLKL